MTYRLISIINAGVLAVFGAMFFLMPEFGLEFFGTETYEATIFVARFLGGALIMAAMFIWMAKDLMDSGSERTMTIMLLVCSFVGFILTLVGMVWVNVIRANGWILIVLHVLFMLAYGYLIAGVTIVRKEQEQYKKFQP